MRVPSPPSRPLCLPALLLGLLLLWAGGRGEAAPEPAPGGIPVPAYVAEARRAVRASDGAATLRVLRAGEPLRLEEPERAWLLVMLWPEWCGSERAREAARALPHGDLRRALVALSMEEPERGLQLLQAAPRGPARGWRDLARARLHARLGDLEAARSAATLAARSPRAFIREDALVLRAALHLEDGELVAAELDARAAALLDPQDARPARFLARVHRAAGKKDEAALALLEAVRIAPESEGYARRLAETLREDVDAKTWAAVDEALQGLGGGNPRNAELKALRAMAAERSGRLDEAIPLYRAALDAGAVPVPLDRELRRALLRTGRFTEALALLWAAVPPEVFDDPHNLLRDRWVRLRQAAEGTRPGPGAPHVERSLLAFAEALVGVGALPEALSVLQRVRLPEALALARRVRGQVAFEDALRRWVEGGFRTASRKEDPNSLGVGLRALTRFANEHLVPEERAAFRNPAQGLRSLPLVGSWLDHSTHTSSPAVAHFRRYGHFFLFGQHTDAPPEAVVFSLASLSASQPIRTGGRLYRHDVAVGYDRVLRSYITAQGGEMGGACLADGVWLDADAARRQDHDLRRRLAYDPAYAAAVARSGAMDVDTLEGPFALSDPGCTAARLIARYAARHPNDPWGSYRTLRTHEFGHVADIRKHLPILPRLPNTIGLVFRNGFSIDRVQIELEGRAQLAAVMGAPDPDLALAEMLSFLPVTERDPEPHAGGYRDALRSMIIHIQNRADLYPQIDRTKRVVSQLDRLSNEQIREVARAVAW